MVWAKKGTGPKMNLTPFSRAGPGAGGRVRLARERAMGRGRAPFAPQDTPDRPRAARGHLLRPALARAHGPLGAAPRLRLRRALLRRGERHARAARLGQPDRDRLLRALRTVLAFADVVHLLADEFSRLRARRLAFPAILRGALQRGLLWHGVASLRFRKTAGV